MIQLNQANVTFQPDNTDGIDIHPTTFVFQLNIDKGEKVAIIGKSGAGKSTLLNLIAGFVFIDNPINSNDNGKVVLDGVEHTASKPYQRPVSMLFQSNNLFNHLTVADNIGLGLKPNLKLTVEDKQHVKKVASQVGLADMLERKPAQLSGGQQQRVALARCLLRDKPILLLDEPFSALDKALRGEMLDLLIQLAHEKQLTLLIITHQPEELKGFVDRAIEINAGKIREVSI